MSLVVHEPRETAIAPPSELVAKGQAVANACRKIIETCSMSMQGRNYILAEGWQALAAATGLSPRIESVDELHGGDIRAVCVLIRLSDGEIVSRAEGFVGTDETTWFGGEVVNKWGTKKLPKRPKFAIRAMAQTRAVSRACRSALSWVVPLIGKNLETTPAEEIQGMDEYDRQYAPPVDLDQPKPVDPATYKGRVERVNEVVPAKISNEDLKRIGDLLKQAKSAGKLSDEGYRAILEGSYGVTRTTDISPDQVISLIAELSDIVKGESA